MLLKAVLVVNAPAIVIILGPLGTQGTTISIKTIVWCKANGP